MKKINLLVALCATAIVSGSIVSCGGTTTDDSDLPVVKIGLHTNLGAGAGYSAIQQGFFKEEGVKVEFETGSGPALATKVVEGGLQVSFMGGGVAWHYFRSNQPIKIAALDNLTDDDRLIATADGKGKDLTINSTIEEIGEKLKGAKVALDLTATPATFFSTLVTEYNSKKTDDADKLWYSDGEKAVPAQYADANKIEVVNTTNANLATTMQGGNYDFCVAFAPVSTTLEKDTTKFKTVCKTSTHFNESYQPSTWAVNTNWLANNEETFKKFMRGLVRGMNYRHDHPEKTCEDIETLTKGQVAASTLNTDIAVWLNASQQLELWNNTKMVQYTENIRQSKLTNPEVDSSITVSKANVFSYLIEACNALK